MAKKLFKDCKTGDTVYYIDPEKVEVLPLKIKSIECWSNGFTFRFDEAMGKVGGCISNRSRNNCLFTMLEDANELLKKINNGETLFSVTKGSTMYLVKNGDNTVYKVPIDNITISDSGALHYHYNFEGRKTYFYVYPEGKFSNCVLNEIYVGRSVEPSGYIRVRLFASEDVANKYVEKAAKEQEKRATEKYIKQMQNHDGKPISHQDNLGHDLHYGDTVAYIRRIGYNAHPEIRVGKIIGESKMKITVLDEEEKTNGKPTGWLRGNTEKTDGKHSVEKQNILLLKLAKVNTNSGFIINK